jgi:NADH dehydrogenase FAD-containing subunit
MENAARKRILILGGGFGGLSVARDPSVDITLINRDNFFFFYSYAS